MATSLSPEKAGDSARTIPPIGFNSTPGGRGSRRAVDFESATAQPRPPQSPLAVTKWCYNLPVRRAVVRVLVCLSCLLCALTLGIWLSSYRNPTLAVPFLPAKLSQFLPELPPFSGPTQVSYNGDLKTTLDLLERDADAYEVLFATDWKGLRSVGVTPDTHVEVEDTRSGLAHF